MDAPQRTGKYMNTTKCRRYSDYILICVVSGFFIWRIYSKSGAGKHLWAASKLKLPIE